MLCSQRRSTYILAVTNWYQQYRRINADLQAVDKAQRQHLDNLRPEATEERQKELSKGANQALHALAPVYSLVILQHSTYKQVRHCTPSPLLM
jgi:NADH:ubiquinone oxidoreductase subunit E